MSPAMLMLTASALFIAVGLVLALIVQLRRLDRRVRALEEADR